MSVENLVRVVVDTEEEMLLTEIQRSCVEAGKTASFFCGIDCGSTQTRSILMPQELAAKADGDLEEWFERYMVIPSLSRAVPIRTALKVRSRALYDNLDSTFSINGQPEVRLVRGSKFNDVETTQNELIANTKKITSEVTLFNIVDAIGYNIVQHSAMTGEPLPSRVNLELSIAFPPDDMLERDLATFHSSIRRFSWMMTGKMSDPIEVTVTKFAAYSEPAAQIQAYFAFADEEAPEEVLLLESGGRNSAPVIMLNGAPVGTGLKSIGQSGSLLLDKIGMAYIERHGGKSPSRRLLEHAVRTGKMKNGNEYRDIVPIIKKCKDDVAEDLFQKLQSDILSKQSVVSLESLNVVLLSGRVYHGGDYNYSVANKLRELIAELAPATKVKIIQRNRIPQGLILLYLLDNILAD